MARNAQLVGMVRWPTEAQSLAFANLDAIRQHVGAAGETLAAVEVRTGALSNRSAFFATLPPSTVARAVAAPPIVPQQAVAANAVSRSANLRLVLVPHRKLCLTQYIGQIVTKSWPRTIA